ncbi:MAG: ABC transporter substrate-binding protein [Clostridiales bacterium]|nr:ABC transporter substrate-binding protein [Clostridiales bacterium]
MKKIISLVMVMMMALTVVGAAAAEGEQLKIGIIQLVQHDALDACYYGFVQALADNGYVDGENIVIDYQNGQGDQSNLATIADRFVGNKSDLVLAIATPAALAVAGKTTEIPIFATAITDFVEARLIDSNEVPGTNVTGTTDLAAIATQIDLVKTLVPEAKIVGVLYNSGEVNSVVQANQAKEAIEALGLEYVERTVTNSNEVQQATQSIVGACDAIYIPTDNVFAASMPIVYGVTVETKTPVICGESGMVLQGGVATLGIDYYKLGYQTGEMALPVLSGEVTDISTMSIQTQTNYTYTINKTIADEIGMEIPADLMQYAVEME